MRRFTLFLMSLFLTLGTIVAQNYVPAETRISSEELNAKTAPALIAIKNLSATNKYWFVGNTGAVPYSKADFSNDAVFVWQPVTEGVAGSYYLMKLDGTYMQATSPKDFGTIDGAAVFTTTNPTTDNGEFNGDGDSMSFIDDQTLLVRFTNAAGTWINVQNGDGGTPVYNSGKGGWTIHYVYAVEESAVEPEPEVPFTVVAVTPTEAVESLETITIEFSEEIEGTFEDMAMSQIYLGTRSNGCKFEVNGKVLAITPFNAITTPGEYALIIPEGLITRKSNGEPVKMNGEYVFTVKEATVEPEPENPNALKVYQILAKDAARGALYATAENTHLTHCGATYGNYHNRDIAVNAEDINQQFVFIEYEGMTYLYSLGAKKFASKDGQYVKLTEIPEGYVTVTDADIAGYKLILFNGENRLNFSGGYDHGVVANYETPDDGNHLVFTEVGTFDPTEVIAEVKAKIEAEAEALAAARAAFNAKYTEAQAILAEANLSVVESELPLQVTDATAAAYVWSNKPEPNEGPIAQLVDGIVEEGNFFHTNWSDGNEQPRYHYIEVDLGEGNGLAEFSFKYTTRFAVANDYPDAIQVMGSNDKETYNELYNVTSGLPQTGGTQWTSNIISSETAYRYLRFNVDAERTYWHMSEFDIVTSEISVAEKYAAVAKAVVALDNAFKAAENNAEFDKNELNAAIEALNAAIEAINEGLAAEPEVPAGKLNVTKIFDFTRNTWGIPTYEETNYNGVKSAVDFVNDEMDIITIDPTANGGQFYYENGFLRLGKPGSKIILPAFDFAVEKIEVVGHPNATSYKNTDMNVYVGGNAVSTPCIGSTDTYTYEIAADNQAAGNVYELVIGSNGGNYSSVMYITYIKVYPAENVLEAPVITPAGGVYVGAQTVNVHSATADLKGVTDVTYYYTLDGNEPTTEDEETDGEITISENCTLKVVVELTYGEETYLSASTSAEYIISESADFNKATAFYPGEYVMVANGYIAAPAKDNFLPAAETTVNGNAVSAAVYYTLTFESAEGGYYIKNTKGEYISTSGTAMKDKTDIYHNQYPSGSWNVTIKEDGTADITSNGQTLVFDAASNTFVTYLTDKVPADAVYPALYSAPLRMTGIKPADGAVVESLKEIRVMFNNPVVLDESKEITLTDSEGTSANIGSSVNGTELVISVNEDLYNGDYTLTIAENAVSDMNGNSYGEAITATYELKYALDTFVPVSITPAEGETVETLKTIVLDFTPDFPGRIIDETVINVTDENGNQVATGKLRFSSASYYAVEIVLNEEIATAGTYTVTIPMGCIWNSKWQGVTGRYNPEIVLTYTVTGSTFEVVNVTPDPEAEHASIKTIHVEFSDNIYTDVLTQDDAFGISGPNGKIYYASWSILEKVLIITLYEEATAPGVYTLDIPGNAFKRLKDSRPFEGARYTFTVSVPEGIEGIGAENETKTIYDLTGRKIDQITKPGIYIVDGKKVMVK